MSGQDFEKAINSATHAVDETEQRRNHIFGWLQEQPSAVEEFQKRISAQEAEQEKKLPNANNYDLEFFCERFIIGNEIVGSNDAGFPMYEPRDDSEKYKKIVDGSLAGSIVVFDRKTTFLKDGTTVIWVEWGERPEKPDTPDS